MHSSTKMEKLMKNHICIKPIPIYQTVVCFKDPGEKAIRKHCGKGKTMLEHFLLFPQRFLHYPSQIPPL